MDLESVNVDLQREQVLERLRGQAQGMQGLQACKMDELTDAYSGFVVGIESPNHIS